MNANFRLVALFTVALFGTACSTVQTRSQNVGGTQTAFLPARVITPLAELESTIPGHRHPVPDLSLWSHRNNAKVVDARVVIEEGSFTGLEIDYLPSETPASFMVCYSRFELPFIIPPEWQDEKAVAESWKNMKSRYEHADAHPLLLVSDEKDGARVARGLWYVIKNSTHVRYEKGRGFVATYNRASEIGDSQRILGLPAAMPDITKKRPDLVLRPAPKEVTIAVTEKAPESRLSGIPGHDVTMMAPVAALAPFLDYRVAYGPNKMIKHLIVESVTKGMPLTTAGMRKGDHIVAIQGIDVTQFRNPSDLEKRLKETPLGDKFSVVVERGGQQITFNVTFQPIRGGTVAAADRQGLED